jgi:hypothetical protein
MISEKIQTKKLSIEQKKNRLKEQEAKLKMEERKARNRRIFELGGLVAKAKLDHLNADQLYGALLSIAEETNKVEVLSHWAQKGGDAFSSDKASQGTPISVTFPDKPSMEIRQQLRALGLKWNSLKEVWQGIGDVEKVREVVERNGGIFTAI